MHTDWRRRTGRPRQTWLRTVEDDLRPLNFGLATARRRTMDRPAWRLLVNAATSSWHAPERERVFSLWKRTARYFAIGQRAGSHRPRKLWKGGRWTRAEVCRPERICLLPFMGAGCIRKSFENIGANLYSYNLVNFCAQNPFKCSQFAQCYCYRTVIGVGAYIVKWNLAM